MHCSICDNILSEKEIIFNKDLDGYEPCTTCLDVAMDAAYSGDFKHDEEDDKFVVLDEDDYTDPRNLASMSFWRGVHDRSDDGE